MRKELEQVKKDFLFAAEDALRALEFDLVIGQAYPGHIKSTESRLKKLKALIEKYGGEL